MEFTYLEVLTIENPGISQFSKIDTKGDPKLFLFLLRIQEEVKNKLKAYGEAKNKLALDYGILGEDGTVKIQPNGREIEYKEPKEETRKLALEALAKLNEEKTNLDVKPIPMSYLVGKESIDMEAMSTIWKLIAEE